MLQEPMMNKLTAMRLLGMVDALKAQEQDPASRELSFLERLGLLVDHQWNWRENQALARRLHTAKLKGGACVEEIDYRTSRGLDKSVMRALAQTSAWVVNHENIFVLGPTGVGKSFVACALAQKACRDGYSALSVHSGHCNEAHFFAESIELRPRRNPDRIRRAADRDWNGDVQARFHNGWHGCPQSRASDVLNIDTPRRFALAHCSL
jgi:predicted AAA+ superfamily ATPase